jgi:hypothetical protein
MKTKDRCGKLRGEAGMSLKTREIVVKCAEFIENKGLNAMGGVCEMIGGPSTMTREFAGGSPVPRSKPIVCPWRHSATATVMTLKLKEQSGNVYENKGPLWKTPRQSWNVYERYPIPSVNDLAPWTDSLSFEAKQNSDLQN